MSLIVSFETWKSRNSDLHNFQVCPNCFGKRWIVEDEDWCFFCDGKGKVDDLYSLYLRDVERTLVLMYRFYYPPFSSSLLASFNKHVEVFGGVL